MSDATCMHTGGTCSEMTRATPHSIDFWSRRQNKLSFEDIDTVGKQFDKYDTDRSGTLDVNDIVDDGAAEAKRDK